MKAAHSESMLACTERLLDRHRLACSEPCNRAPANCEHNTVLNFDETLWIQIEHGFVSISPTRRQCAGRADNYLYTAAWLHIHQHVDTGHRYCRCFQEKNMLPRTRISLVYPSSLEPM